MVSAAVTVHKIMGATLPSVLVDCGAGKADGMFEAFQLLVAISRPRALDCLEVINYKRHRDPLLASGHFARKQLAVVHNIARTHMIFAQKLLVSLGFDTTLSSHPPPTRVLNPVDRLSR